MQKTLLIVIALCTALMVAACVPQQATPATEPAPTPAPVVQAPPVSSPEPVLDNQDGVTRLADLPKDVSDIINKGLGQKANGFSYNYLYTQDSKLGTSKINNLHVLQRDDLRKVTFASQYQLDREFFVAYYIVDDEAGTTTAYCTRRDCNGVPTPSQRSLSYQEYDFKTPSMWLEVIEDIQKLGEETISGRATYKLSTSVDGTPATVWLDRFSGLPLQVEQGNIRYEYRDFVLGVKESDIKG